MSGMTSNLIDLLSKDLPKQRFIGPSEGSECYHNTLQHRHRRQVLSCHWINPLETRLGVCILAVVIL